jgi:peptidoglycan/xylan/chitin deacetylase (PgdA/CDA1 family)
LFFDYEGKWAQKGQEENSRKGVERILNILEHGNLRATFNVVANLAIDNMSILRNIVAAGHEIASHTVGHTVVERFSVDQISSDLQKFRYLLSGVALELIGFRSPQSRWNSTTLKGLLRAGILWNAEDDLLPYPYIIAQSGNHRLWRMPVTCDDWKFEALRLSSDEMMGVWRRAILNAIKRGYYIAIGFHPWVLGQDETRLDALAELVEFLRCQNNITVAPFGDVARLCESEVKGIKKV